MHIYRLNMPLQAGLAGTIGDRAWIGVIKKDMGDFLILFNNDTGNVEWIDCGYGYFDVYEENPNGIIANDIDGFLSKLD